MHVRERSILCKILLFSVPICFLFILLMDYRIRKGAEIWWDHILFRHIVLRPFISGSGMCMTRACVCERERKGGGRCSHICVMFTVTFVCCLWSKKLGIAYVGYPTYPPNNYIKTKIYPNPPNEHYVSARFWEFWIRSCNLRSSALSDALHSRDSVQVAKQPTTWCLFLLRNFPSCLKKHP